MNKINQRLNLLYRLHRNGLKDQYSTKACILAEFMQVPNYNLITKKEIYNG